MKLGPVTKLDNRNTATSKKSDDVKSANFDINVFFLMVNLQPSGTRIPDAWSVKLIFSSTITFYLTKTENK